MKTSLRWLPNTVVALLIVLIFGIIGMGTFRERATAQTPAIPKIQILLPLYQYPAWYSPTTYLWDDVAAANSIIPVTFIINPNSGPDGGPPNEDFVRGMKDLREAGVKMIGYILTNYGNRNINDVLKDIDIYNTHFVTHGLTGIFFDEVASTGDKIAYYEQLYSYVKAKPNLKQVFLNPGTQIAEVYLSRPAGDVAIIADNLASEWPAYQVDSYVANYPANRFGAVIHTASTNLTTMRTQVDLAVARNLNYFYLTNDDENPNPWDTLPTFWNDLLTYMQQINAAATLTPTGTATPTASATPSATPTATLSTPSATVTLTATPTPSVTLSTTPSPTFTPTPISSAPAPIYLAMVSNALTAVPTATPTPQPRWQQVSQGRIEVAALAMQGDQLYIGDRRNFDQGGGLYSRSLNNCSGPTAFERNNSISSRVLGIGLQGTQGAVAAYDNKIYYLNNSQWQQTASDVGLARTIALAGGNVFYAGAELQGIFRSDNGGETWVQQSAQPQLINILQLNASTLWIGADGTGVWILTVGNNVPQERNAGLPNNASKQVYDFAFRSTTAEVYIATYDGVYKGDGVNAWQPFGLQGKGNELLSLTIQGDQLYAGGRNGASGVWQRPLDGGDWVRLTSPGWKDSYTVRDLLYVASCQGLLAATDDGVWLYR